jgi:hypothetical protein
MYCGKNDFGPGEYRGGLQGGKIITGPSTGMRLAHAESTIAKTSRKWLRWIRTLRRIDYNSIFRAANSSHVGIA